MEQGRIEYADALLSYSELFSIVPSGEVMKISSYLQPDGDFFRLPL